ncbi:hypothetical protein [Sulfurisphaera ohwakuensis]|uniref:hypothetical protein n=1 Tax=Sulfurisphaera ohwakuensis TaxID=69656 RepID=UPI0036F2FFCB
MGFSWNDILNPIKNILATGYKLTRVGLTDLYTSSGALGEEVGTFIKTGHFIPFNQAIQRAENQPAVGPFSFLNKVGIYTGKQLFNAESQLASTFIPITGTFGHLAAHPNEPLLQKVSDIAFGILDIPTVAEVGDFARALIRGSDELSPIGRIAEQIGKSKAFYGPLSAIGLGSTILSGFSNPSNSSTSSSYSYLNTFGSNQNFASQNFNQNNNNISYIQYGNNGNQSGLELNTIFSNNKNNSYSPILLILLFILLIIISIIIIK